MAIQQMENDDFVLKGANINILKKATENVIKSKKCYRCDYASFWAGDLKKHLIMHSGEKSNKCSQCDYASSEAVNLRKHLITHSGEKSNKCSLCDYASSRADSLRTHLKTHTGE